MYCAERYERELNAAMNSQPAAARTPLDITAEDSREDVIEKFTIVRDILCR